MAKVSASDLNIRVTIQQFVQTKDEGGGLTDVLFKSWNVWANKKEPSGRQITEQAQNEWAYDTKFTVRYNKAFKSDFILIDPTGRWPIKSLTVSEAGYKEWMILSCSKIDDDLS